MIAFIENALEVALIVLLALGLMPLLRRRPAALRHFLLAAAIACAAAAPVVGLVAPAWRLPVPVAASSAGAGYAVGTPAGLPSAPVGVRAGKTNVPGEGSPALSALLDAVVWIWAAGCAFGLAVLGAGLVRLRRVAAGARELTQGAWVRHVEDLRRGCGVRQRVRILQSRESSLLVTWGVLQPKILVPAGAAAWTPDRIRAVLTHELAHIRRHDWIVTLAAEVLRAIHWFNPAVWAACRRLREESERACDDAVLSQGVEGSDYAAHLVGIARELHQRRMWVPAPSIVRPTSLERRVTAMLDPLVNRRPVSSAARAAALFAVLAMSAALTGAAFAQVFSTVAGSIVDPMKAPLAGVTLVLTNTQSQAKYEVKSDRTGRYEVVGLPPGEYVLEATLPGFSALRGKLSIAGQNVQQDLALEIGSLQETVTVRASAATAGGSPTIIDAAGGVSRRRDPRPCQPAPAQGGSLRPPMKVRDVPPVYPSAAAAAGIEGTVTLRARIGDDGTVDEASVVSSPNADLSASAVDAVRQWEFTPTLLNCVATAVNMTVTVNFERER
jgi:TonB family protein